MKKIILTISRSALNTQSSIEAMRLALGISMSKDVNLTLLLYEKAVFLSQAKPLKIGMPDVEQSFELLAATGVKIYALESSLERYKLTITRDAVLPITDLDAANLIGSASGVLSF